MSLDVGLLNKPHVFKLTCMNCFDLALITFGIDSCCPLFFITALIIYGADIDYSRRFYEEGDDFIVDDDDLMLMRDNGSLVATFPSGKITRTAKTRRLNKIQNKIKIHKNLKTKRRVRPFRSCKSHFVTYVLYVFRRS